MPFEAELQLALRAMEQAGALALGYQARGVEPEDKADASPVTIADRESERLLVAAIEKQYPADGLLGEEGANKPATNGRKWIIDPIDGTRDFVRGNRLWSSLLGLEVDGRVALGVAHFPALNETYWAVRGQGAFRNGRRLAISAITDVSRAVGCINQLNNTRKRPHADRMLGLLEKFWAVRGLGGAMDALWVAAGHAEFWLEPSAKPWDLAPLQIIAQEAGALYMDYQGRDSIYSGNALICVPALEPLARWFLDLQS